MNVWMFTHADVFALLLLFIVTLRLKMKHILLVPLEIYCGCLSFCIFCSKSIFVVPCDVLMMPFEGLQYPDPFPRGCALTRDVHQFFGDVM